MYNETVLTLDRQRHPHVVRATGRTGSDDGTLIFCGISLVLLIVALWGAASGHADISVML
jgi:hypothetical protein